MSNLKPLFDVLQNADVKQEYVEEYTRILKQSGIQTGITAPRVAYVLFVSDRIRAEMVSYDDLMTIQRIVDSVTAQMNALVQKTKPGDLIFKSVWGLQS